jgi:hypothetical protein
MATTSFPGVPSSSAPFGFRHVGVALTCPSGGAFAGIPSRQGPQSNLGLIDETEHAFSGEPGETAEQSAFPAAFPLVAKLIETLPHPVRDHLPDRYVSALHPPLADKAAAAVAVGGVSRLAAAVEVETVDRTRSMANSSLQSGAKRDGSPGFSAE